MIDKTACGCIDECLHKPGCAFEQYALARSAKEMPSSLNDACRTIDGLVEEIERLQKQLGTAVEALRKAEYASRKDSLIDAERLASVRTVVCAAISKLSKPLPEIGDGRHSSQPDDQGTK